MIRCRDDGCPQGKDICCYSCEEFEDCADKCDDHFKSCGSSEFDEMDEELALQTFEHNHRLMLHEISTLIKVKDNLEQQEKDLKDRIKSAMETYGVKKFESDILNITYVAESTSTSIDSAKLKKKYPDIAEECSKVSKRSSYVKISVK
jgi:hypothetical protein